MRWVLWIILGLLLVGSLVIDCHQFEFHHHVDFDWGETPMATPSGGGS